jgi:hypothetical protein
MFGSRQFGRWCILAALACLPARATLPCEAALEGLASRRSLADFVVARPPWSLIEAGSEQRNPMYLGATPREMRVEGKLAARPTLREPLRRIANEQVKRILHALGEPQAELEAWPALNDHGDPTWVYARWRKSPRHAWRWLDQSMLGPPPELESEEPRHPDPFLPQTLRPWIEDERKRLFEDFLKMESLYDKPAHADCVWTTPDGKKIRAAWLPVDSREELAERVGESREWVAHRLPQPPRLNETPIAFTLRAGPHGVTFPEQIDWRPELPVRLPRLERPLPEIEFGRAFQRHYTADMRRLSGEKRAEFPISGRKVRFTRKSSAQPDHQLELFNDYLEERYRLLQRKYPGLGIQLIRQKFQWRGIEQSNLMFVIPGRRHGRENRPIVLADHIDTAFAEDIYE